MENPIRKLASQTAVYGLSSIIGRLVNYLLTPLYTYYFLPEAYGTVVELYTYTSFLIVLLTYGMETAFFRYAGDGFNSDKVFSSGLLLLIFTTSVFVLVCLLFQQHIANALHYSENPEYISWFTWIVAIDIITALPFSYLRKNNQALRFALIRLGGIAINVSLNLFFIVYCPSQFPNGTWFYNPSTGVGYIFVSNLISSIFTLILLLPFFGKMREGMDSSILKKMIFYGIPLLFAGLAGMINETMDRLLLKYLLPEPEKALEQIGIYGACYKISIIMTLFVQTFRYAAEPFYFSHKNKQDAPEMYARVMNYFVIICTYIFLVTLVFLDIIKLFIGEAYRSGLHIVPLLLLANMFLGIFNNLSIWYKLSGKTYHGAILTGIGALLTILSNAILIPVMGYTGAAYATLVCYFSIMILSWFYGRKHLPIPYYTGKFILYTSTAVGLYFLSVWLNTLGLHFIFSGTICLLLLTSVVWLKDHDMFSMSLKSS